MATERFCETCGAPRNEGAGFCGTCGHQFADTAPPPETVAQPPPTPQPEPTAPAPPAPTISAPVATADGGRRTRQRWIIGLLVLALLVGGGVVYALTKGDSSSSSAKGGEVLLQAAAEPGSDPFTASVATGSTATPAATLPTPTTAPLPAGALQSVQGSTPGLYGGTKNVGSCDPEKMIAFLASEPAKAQAWAGAIGIPVAQIAEYIRSLTPVVLTRDTRVTNHGFANGVATPLQAVLQAGTAVLVDQYGVPRAKCACGNPLKPPIPAKAPPHYTGTPWPGFQPTNIIVVVVNVTVPDFVLVDQSGGRPFTRPAGTTGASDAGLSADLQARFCRLFPADPSCSTPSSTTTSTTTTTTPKGQPSTLLEITSIAGVSNGPSQPSVLVLTRATTITKIVDYHWNSGTGASPGTIGLRSSDGKVYGPWAATGSPGQGGVPNAYWTATPNAVVPAGTYEIVDSDPATWAWASDTGGRGIVTVSGF